MSIFFLFLFVWLVDWSFETQLRLALNLLCAEGDPLGLPAFTSQCLDYRCTLLCLVQYFCLFHFRYIYILFLIYDCKSLPGSNSSLLLVHFPESVYYNDKV